MKLVSLIIFLAFNTISFAQHNVGIFDNAADIGKPKTAGTSILTAAFEFTGEKGNGHRKIGWMIRESPDEAAASVNAVIHGDGLTVLQWRPLRGAYMRDPEDEVF